MRNFRSHSLQIWPRFYAGIYYSTPPSATSSLSVTTRLRLNNLVFLRHFLHVDMPQKWQWLLCRSPALLHFSRHVLHPSGVLWYWFLLIGSYIVKMLSFSSKRYSRSPIMNFLLVSNKASILLCILLIAVSVDFVTWIDELTNMLWLKAESKSFLLPMSLAKFYILFYWLVLQPMTPIKKLTKLIKKEW